MAPTPKQQVASAKDYLAFAVGLWRAAERAKPDRGNTFYFLAAFSVEVGVCFIGTSGFLEMTAEIEWVGHHSDHASTGSTKP